LAPPRRLVDIGRPQRIRLDTGLVEQREAAWRTGGENEFGAAEHQEWCRRFLGNWAGVKCARNLSEGGCFHNPGTGAGISTHSQALGKRLPVVYDVGVTARVSRTRRDMK